MDRGPASVAANWKPNFFTLAYGQFISVLITGTGVFASLLSRFDKHANNPMLLAAITYALLFLYFNGKRVFREGSVSTLKNPWYWYLIVAFLDVEANVLAITAYKYTSITSVMLLDCFSIPCTMALSYVFLQAQYTPYHCAGVLLCVGGLGLTVYSDILRPQPEDAHPSRSPLYGDCLCILAAVMYSCSNVFQEVMVKATHRTEYLSSLGFFGLVIAATQSALFERASVAQLELTTNTSLCVSGFVLCLFLIYCNSSQFLKHADAPLFNLSLLTSDVYAVVFAYLAYDYSVHWLYYVAFAVTCAGLTLYHCVPANPTTALEYESRRIVQSSRVRAGHGLTNSTERQNLHYNAIHTNNRTNLLPSIDDAACGLGDTDSDDSIVNMRYTFLSGTSQEGQQVT
jgi:solute carrier family 35, member F1/2